MSHEAGLALILQGESLCQEPTQQAEKLVITHSPGSSTGLHLKAMLSAHAIMHLVQQER